MVFAWNRLTFNGNRNSIWRTSLCLCSLIWGYWTGRGHRHLLSQTSSCWAGYLVAMMLVFPSILVFVCYRLANLSVWGTYVYSEPSLFLRTPRPPQVISSPTSLRELSTHWQLYFIQLLIPLPFLPSSLLTIQHSPWSPDPLSTFYLSGSQAFLVHSFPSLFFPPVLP